MVMPARGQVALGWGGMGWTPNACHTHTIPPTNLESWGGTNKGAGHTGKACDPHESDIKSEPKIGRI